MAGKGYGWHRDVPNSELDILVAGTIVLTSSATAVTLPAAVTSGLTVAAGGLTVTAGGLTVTAGDCTTTAGDMHVVAQNFYLGAETAFGTTEPTSAMIFKEGTAPAGAIATSSALFSSATVLRKIIAASTVSNVA